MKTLELIEDSKIEELLKKINQEYKFEEIYSVEEIQKKTTEDVNKITKKVSNLNEKNILEKKSKKRKADEVFTDEELEKTKNKKSRKNEKSNYKPTLLDEIFQKELDYYESNRSGKDYYHARQIFGFLAKKGHAPSKFPLFVFNSHKTMIF